MRFSPGGLVFTGLIEDIGTIAAIAPGCLTIQTAFAPQDLTHGASVAVDGVCLTVVGSSAGTFSVDVSPETLQRTTLGALQPGARVNLERPMALGDRLGGHLVLGHVDGVGSVVSREEMSGSVRFILKLPESILPLVVEKGSIALDGISLTVNDLPASDQIALMLIPESLRATTWGAKQPGARVNVEADILGKHVARLLQFKEKQHG